MHTHVLVKLFYSISIFHIKTAIDLYYIQCIVSKQNVYLYFHILYLIWINSHSKRTKIGRIPCEHNVIPNKVEVFWFTVSFMAVEFKSFKPIYRKLWNIHTHSSIYQTSKWDGVGGLERKREKMENKSVRLWFTYRTLSNLHSYRNGANSFFSSPNSIQSKIILKQENSSHFKHHRFGFELHLFKFIYIYMYIMVDLPFECYFTP